VILNLIGFHRFSAKPVWYTSTGPRQFDRTGNLNPGHHWFSGVISEMLEREHDPLPFP